MEYFIKEKIQEYEVSSNPTEKVVKINHSLEFIIIYYSTIFYLHTIANNVVSREMVEIILTNFYKKNPLTSAWIKLLKSTLDILKVDTNNYYKNTGKLLQNIANHYLPIESNKIEVENPSLKIILDCIQIIRNKAFAHSNSINEKDVTFLLKNGFDKIPYELDSFLNKVSSSKLLLSETIPQIDGEMDSSSTANFIDLSTDIKKNYSLPMNGDIDYSNVFSKSMYCYFEKDKILIPTSPFMLCRDNNYYYYNGIDNKGYPIYNDIFSAKSITIKKYENAFKDTVQDNINLLTSSEIIVKLKEENKILHNLPNPIYLQFIGRDESYDKIIKALRNKRIFLVAISGIGGVGKSALAIKTTRNIIESKSDMFSFIIWVSAKKTYLTPEGVVSETQIFSNLLQLFDVILKITGFTEYLKSTFKVKKEATLQILSMDSFLIIVDNFETVLNPHEFLEFFEEVGDSCDNSKIIITTRHQLGSSEKIIDLKEFSFNEYEDFTNYLLTDKFKINEKCSSKDVRTLYELTGGLALATEFFVGQINKHNSLDKILKKVNSQEISKESILEFSFKESFELLNIEEKKVLFSISLLDNPTLNNVCFLTSFDEFHVEEIVGRLKNLSFLNKNIISEEIKYSILPLTKTFLINSLPRFQQLNTELTTKYEEYQFITNVSRQITQYEPIQDVSVQKDSIVVRLSRAAYFLASQGNFSKSEEYFNQAVTYDSKNSSVWYQWALAERDFSNNIKDEYFEKSLKYADEEEKKTILFEWGKSFASVNRHKQSIEIFKKYLELNPTNKNVCHFIGKSYYEIGRNLWKKQLFTEMKENYQKSLDAFKSSLYENPTTHFEKNHNVVGYYFIAKIYRVQKDLGNSILFVKKGLDLQPNNFRMIEFSDELAKMTQDRNRKYI